LSCHFALWESMRDCASVSRVVLFSVVAASLRSQTRAAPATLDFVAETPDHRPVLNLRADEIVLKEDGVVKPLKSFQPLFSGELQIRRSRDAGNRFSGSVVALLDASFFLAPTVGPPRPRSIQQQKLLSRPSRNF
jgi:hypothetical protein